MLANLGLNSKRVDDPAKEASDLAICVKAALINANGVEYCHAEKAAAVELARPPRRQRQLPFCPQPSRLEQNRWMREQASSSSASEVA